MTSYNGYTNRETWAAALHLSNDEVLYHRYVSPLKIDYEGAELGLRIRYTLHNLFILDKFASTFEDIGDLSKVNWQEVADSLK